MPSAVHGFQDTESRAMAKIVHLWLAASFTFSLHHGGAEAQVKVVVPQGIASVNGSAVDMGCTSSLVASGSFMVCTTQSFLVDGCSPDIDTSTSDWASQLVTVRKAMPNRLFDFPHVLLTFGFDTAVSLTGIEIDLFQCTDWNIGAPHITVYINEKLNFSFDSELQFAVENPSRSSCAALTTVTITGDSFAAVSSYHTLHVLLDLLPNPAIEWVHVGGVRFLGFSSTPTITASNCVKRTILERGAFPSLQLQPTSVPGDRENDCTCSEESSSSAVIAVSAVSLLLIVILTTVILTQCLLIIRMRRSRNKVGQAANLATSRGQLSEILNPTATKKMDVTVFPNEAYELQRTVCSREEAIYEVVTLQ